MADQCVTGAHVRTPAPIQVPEGGAGTPRAVDLFRSISGSACTTWARRWDAGVMAKARAIFIRTMRAHGVQQLQAAAPRAPRPDHDDAAIGCLLSGAAAARPVIAPPPAAASAHEQGTADDAARSGRVMPAQPRPWSAGSAHLR